MYVGQITRSGFRLDVPGALDALADEFAQRHHVRLDRLVERALFDRWMARLATAPFVHRVSADWVGPPPVDLFLDAKDLEYGFEFAVNDPTLFRVIERITRCEPIGSFDANIHRMTAGAGHVDRWHNDVDGSRLAGLSLNMSAGAYAGGSLQFADAGTGAVIQDVVNPAAGDAIVFEISPRVAHCVAELTAGTRTVFAGWFARTPSVREWWEAVLEGRG